VNFTEKHINGHFKDVGEGRTAFFPFGQFGKGYVLPSEQARLRLRLRSRVSTFYVISYPLVAFLIYASIDWWPFWLCFSVVGAYTALGYLLFWMECQNLEPSDEEFSWNASFERVAKSRSIKFFAGSFVGCIVFAFTAIIYMLTIDTNNGFWGGLAFATVSAVYGGVHLKLLITKRKLDKT
jgi:hypothetical protein